MRWQDCLCLPRTRLICPLRTATPTNILLSFDHLMHYFPCIKSGKSTVTLPSSKGDFHENAFYRCYCSIAGFWWSADLRPSRTSPIDRVRCGRTRWWLQTKFTTRSMLPYGPQSRRCALPLGNWRSTHTSTLCWDQSSIIRRDRHVYRSSWISR